MTTKITITLLERLLFGIRGFILLRCNRWSLRFFFYL